MTAPTVLKTLLGERCSDDAERLRPYEHPERGAPGRARCVLWPQSEDEVAAVLRTCTAHSVALVLSAGRTGLVEAQRPQGEAVLSLERLNRPLRLVLADGSACEFAAHGNPDQHADALVAWWRQAGSPDLAGAAVEVQAGLAVDALNAILAPLGLMWPMEMGSSAAATVGACVANASAGANAVCYGTAAHMCEQAWGFWASGDPAGPFSHPAWQRPAADRLALDSASVRPDLGLIASQGLFGVITRLRLRTFRVPASREAVLLPAATLARAMAVLEAAREAFGDAVEEFEFIGAQALALVRELRGEGLRLPYAEDPQAPYHLLLQVKSDAEDPALVERLYALVAERLGVSDAFIGYAPLKALKAIRHSITEASNARLRVLGGGRLAFDTAVPVARFDRYLQALERAVAAVTPDLEFVAFGHAGVGGLHLHLLGTRAAPVQVHAEALVAAVFDVTGQFGGTFSAEHGIGPKWGREWQQRMPQALRERVRAAKRAHDPTGILQPRAFGIDRA